MIKRKYYSIKEVAKHNNCASSKVRYYGKRAKEILGPAKRFNSPLDMRYYTPQQAEIIGYMIALSNTKLYTVEGIIHYTKKEFDI